MILIVGGVGSGKRMFAETLGFGDGDFSVELDDGAPVLCDAQEIVRVQHEGCDPVQLADCVAACKQVALLVDVGSGIVPLDPQERAWRDRVGLLGRELAERAEVVVRMVCGIPVVLKGELPSGNAPCRCAVSDAFSSEQSGLQLIIMRHGTSTYNEERRYAGWTDVPLSDRGRDEALRAGVCPQVEKVYVSPLLRARQTAEICFPNAQQVVVDGLQEMNFGDFEGRTAAEMENDVEYRAWVEGMCTTRCPNGEGQDDMIERMERAVGEVVRQAQAAREDRAIIVAHGGTIMAALTGISGDGSDYFGWQVGNCEGYRTTVVDDGVCLHFNDQERFYNLDFLREGAACSEGEHASNNVLVGGGEETKPAIDEQHATCDKAHNRSEQQHSCAEADRPAWQDPCSFFQNRACEYFPCHEGVSVDEFNCLFCYCPLYALGPSCGGNFTYTEKGRKNCTGCVLPHVRNHGASMVMARYELLAQLAAAPKDEQ